MYVMYICRYVCILYCFNSLISYTPTHSLTRSLTLTHSLIEEPKAMLLVAVVLPIMYVRSVDDGF